MDCSRSSKIASSRWSSLLAAFLAVGTASAAALSVFEDAEKVDLPAAAVNPDQARLVLDITFAPGWHLNPEAPFKYSLDGAKIVSLKKPRLPLRLALAAARKSAIDVGVVMAYCRNDGKGVCKQKRVLFHQPLRPDPKGPDKVTIHYKAD